MKRLFLIPTLTFIIGFTLYLSTASNSTGITGVSSTGCTCHGNQNFQTTIALSGLPSTGPIAGTTYSLKLKVTNAVKIQAGFNLSVNQGNISNNSAGTQISNGGLELNHTIAQSLQGDTTVWEFDWTAPVSGPNPLFKISANATDSNGLVSNDAWSSIIITYPLVLPPSLVNTGITGITASTATLQASGIANGGSTAISFEYGYTSADGFQQMTNPMNISGSSATNISTTLNNLWPNTTYHYRFRAQSAAGTVYTQDSTFTTLPASTSIPTLSMNSITNVTTNSASFGGLASANNFGTATALEYGLSTAYGSVMPVTPAMVVQNNVSIAGSLNNLTPNTLYHVRFRGYNSNGFGYSPDTTFTTLPFAPVINLLPVSTVTELSAIVHADILAQGSSTVLQIEYGTTSAYGSTLIPSPNALSSGSFEPVTGILLGLQSNTTYHYRFKAVNLGGTTYSADATFTTKPTFIDEFAQAGFSLFPNPSSGIINLTGLQPNTDFVLSVYTISGFTLLRREITRAAERVVLDFKSLGAGTFILALETQDKTYRTLFTKR